MRSFMPGRADLDRETLLDVTVNLVPMGMLLFFVVLFLVFTPYPPDPFFAVLSELLTIVPLVLLALLTYLAATVIARDERELEARSVGDEDQPPLAETET